MFHYVYYLKHPIDKQLYIGVRSCKCKPISDTAYKSSSKTKSKTYLAECSKHILKTFATRQEATAFEIILHNKYNVSINPKFFNAAKQTSTGFDTTGTKLSPEHRQKIRDNAPRTSRKHSDKSKQLNRDKHKGFNNAVAKIADVYCYKTNKLLASNICLGSYATINNLCPSHLYETANGKRRQHKGVYAKYK